MLSQAWWTLIVYQCMYLCVICLCVYVSEIWLFKLFKNKSLTCLIWRRSILKELNWAEDLPRVLSQMLPIPRLAAAGRCVNQSRRSPRWFWKLWPTSSPQCRWVSFNPKASLITSGSSTRETPSSSLCLVRKRTALALFFNWHSVVNRHEMSLSQRREIFSTGAF